MSKTQEEEIQAVIEKNLPAAVGKVLQQRLKEADYERDQLKQITLKSEHLAASNNTLARTIQEQSDKLKEHGNLKNREKAVVSRERKQENELLIVKLAEAEKRADMVMGFTSGLVRNTTFRKSMWDSQGHPPQMDQYGTWQNPPNSPTSGEETTTQE